MYEPRPYQTKALEAIREQLNDNSSTLLVMATGLGKTITFCQLAAEFMKWGRVMVLAHRMELVYQAYHHLAEITGSQPEIEMADARTNEWGFRKAPIIVSTVQTHIAGRNGYRRMQKFEPSEFSLLIIDESHHSPAKSYRNVIEHYRQNDDLKILGVTATPDRADEQALGQIFETVAFEYGIREGIEDGWLVPIHQRAVFVEGLDYSTVRTTAGDLNGADLAAILEFEETLHRMASPIIEMTSDKKTLVFAASLCQAERLTEIINRHKPGCAEWVHGGTPKEERRSLFQRYKDDAFQYLVNVGVATEGFDEPGIEVVVMGRPTKSRSLYAQMVGRGTRSLSGVLEGISDPVARRSAIAVSSKPVLEVLDFVGNSGRHRLVTSADILAGNYSDEVVERARKNIEKSDKPSEVMSELENAEKELEQERLERIQRAKRAKIKARATYSTATVNPFDVLDIEPHRERGWNIGRPPSEKQLALLTKFGVDTSGLSHTHANQLIGQLLSMSKKRLASYKQCKVLIKFGYDPKGLTRGQASELITAIAKNGWRRPA